MSVAADRQQEGLSPDSAALPSRPTVATRVFEAGSGDCALPTNGHLDRRHRCDLRFRGSGGRLPGTIWNRSALGELCDCHGRGTGHLGRDVLWVRSLPHTPSRGLGVIRTDSLRHAGRVMLAATASFWTALGPLSQVDCLHLGGCASSGARDPKGLALVRVARTYGESIADANARRGHRHAGIRLANRLVRRIPGMNRLASYVYGVPVREARSGGLPVVGGVSELEETISRLDIDCVFVPDAAADAEEMAAIRRASRRTECDLRVATNLPEMMVAPLGIQPVAGSMVITLRGTHPVRGQYLAKRTFDVVTASFLILLFSPLMVAAAIAVKLTSPGPVLFRQPRVTRNRRTFTMLKFRSMRTGADAELDERGADRTTAFFKVGDGDPRVTRVGRLLRAWSIDELPQLFNVVRGDMSLVGPRPLPAEQVAANPALLDSRHEVTAGVSGWWQVSGRSDLTPEAAIALDLYYIENWSLALDVFILMKTFVAVIERRGAR